jgi:hypothetical protein
LLAVAIFWLLSQGASNIIAGPRAHGTNPALDVRFQYDPRVLEPAPYSSSAEFPLQLNAADWSFYGKRIRGAGDMLAKDPGPMLYDFVASQQDDVFGSWYKLKLEGKPMYEDARLQRRLGVHTVTVYNRAPESRGWPAYFPASVTGETEEGNSADLNYKPDTKSKEVLSDSTEEQIVRSIAKAGGESRAVVEGWALYTEHDLFFFYAIAPKPLSEKQRNAAIAVINSMQFDAVLGSGKATK